MTKLALLLTGFGTFLNLYAPQPLLPFFRDLFHASEFRTSLTVSAAVLSTNGGTEIRAYSHKES